MTRAATTERTFATHLTEPEKSVIEAVQAYRPVTWTNPNAVSYEKARQDIPFKTHEIVDAAHRMKRWEPELRRLFPGTDSPGMCRNRSAMIESPLVELSRLPTILARRYSTLPEIPRVFLKLDSHLPVSGSIKARGGFHEVLALTERLRAKGAVFHGVKRPAIAVGSTGNLGLSIGILGAALGYEVTVHMSADARRWKKELLRSRGVTVIEHGGDFSAAVAAGRAASQSDPRCHFVDDERSRELFLGYAAAAHPLRAQLESLGVVVDRDHPLRVYLPCGVGGGPGGVTFGLKEEFGNDVSCYFVEPTHSPAMLAGLVTGLNDGISVQDLGLDNRTIADGLAVGRPSGLVAPAMRRVVSGVFTVPDSELLSLVALLNEHEEIRLEPSAVAGIPGPFRAAGLPGWNNPGRNQPDLKHPATDFSPETTHLVWATGGNMVPSEEMEQWIRAGQELLSSFL